MHNMREAEGIGNNFIVLWPLRGHYTAGIRPARHKDRSHRGKNNYDIEFCCPDPINSYESIVNRLFTMHEMDTEPFFLTKMQKKMLRLRI